MPSSSTRAAIPRRMTRVCSRFEPAPQTDSGRPQPLRSYIPPKICRRDYLSSRSLTSARRRNCRIAHPCSSPLACSITAWMIEELDETADIGIAHQGDARAAPHRHDAVGNHARAGGSRARQESVEPIDLEADIPDADIGDPGRRHGMLAVLKFDQLEVDPRAGRDIR